MAFERDAWESSVYDFGMGRVPQDREIFTPEAVSEISTYPSLFMYEKGQGDTAYLGWITSIKKRGNSVRLEWEREKLKPLDFEDIYKLRRELDIYNFSTTRWEINDADLFQVLIKGKLIRESTIRRRGMESKLVRYGLSRPMSELTVRPTVFRVPSGGVEPDLASVMMPFESSFSRVYDAIKVACEPLSVRCQRVDDIWDEAEIIHDVFSLIYRSRVVICDFSGRNPNVFYEAGIAHTLGKTVIPIVQSESDVPFDLRHHRYIKYLDNGEGREHLAEELEKKLRSIFLK